MSIFSTVLAPLIVLGIGALTVYISGRFLRPQDKGQVETLIIALAIVSLMGGLAHLDQPIRLNRLSDLAVYADKPTWMLALVLLVGGLALSLAGWNQPNYGQAERLMALGSALLLILGADPVLTVVAWALADVSMLYVVGYRQDVNEQLNRTGFLSLLGAALFAIGLMLEATAGQTMFKTAAAVILPWAFAMRLLPLPLPNWQSALGAPSAHPVSSRVLTFLLPSMMALAIGQKFGTLVLFGGSQPAWFALWAALVMLVGGLRAWAAKTPAQLIDHTVWYGMAIILLTFALRLDPAVRLAAGVNVILSTLIFQLTWSHCQYLNLADSRTWWHVLPVVLALGAQVGLPLTLGLPARIAVYTTLFDSYRLVLLPVIVAEALYAGALLRILLDLEPVERTPGEQPTPEAEHRTVALKFEISESWLRRLATHPRLARPIDGLLEQIAGRWLPILQNLFGRIDPAYAGGVLLAVLLLVLGLFPNLLSQTGYLGGPARWIRIPQLAEWAALLLPVIGGIVAYRRQEVILALVQGWWPLVEQVLGLEWLYRGVQKVLEQLRNVLWGATLVVQGAGYMAWVVLVCLIILIFVISR